MRNGARQSERAGHWLWIAAIVLGVGYWFGAAARSGLGFEQLENIPELVVIIWKCLATGALVASAFLAARHSRLLSLSIAVGIIWFADALLALGYVTISGFFFVFAHLIAAKGFFQLPKRQSGKPLVFAVAALTLIAAILAMVWVVEMEGSALIAIFPLFSAIACLTAARSEMPFVWSVLGYSIFFISDSVVVLGIASVEGPGPWGWLVWLTYFSGLVMIVKGIQCYAIEWQSEKAHPQSSPISS